MKMFTIFTRDLRDLLYPETCLVCGDRVKDGSHLCSWCQWHVFEPANAEGNDSCKGLIIPEWICMQDSLWEFDKGGYLQDLLHLVKYGGLIKPGISLGRLLGYKLKHNSWMQVGGRTILLPVPLHPARKRIRGYNQAELIAKGVAEVTGSVVADNNAVIRIRKTRTQTGLNAGLRRENMDGAFRLQQMELFEEASVIIIDDVITTGATAFELAGLIRSYARRIGIATIAKA